MAQSGFASLTLHDTEPPASVPDLRALTLTPPWWWFMLHLPQEFRKNVENRPPGFSHKSFRGDFLFHSAKGMTRSQYDDAVACAVGLVPRHLIEAVPRFEDMPRGCIVGRGRITGLLEPGDSGERWHFPAEYGFLVEDAEPLPLVPCKGALGFWRVPENVLGELRAKGAAL